mmetsp:Transcript_8999/g.13291  ORF Transcript_8999/g.13291 Transcript_8999/m.13291 type:complete len:534 (+) Transcript_8999:1-1602(+)
MQNVLVLPLAPSCTLPRRLDAQNKSLYWKQDLVMPIQFRSLIKMQNVLVLVELLDFDLMQTGKQNKGQSHEIAWGLMKWRKKLDSTGELEEKEMKYEVQLFKYKRLSSFIRKQATCRGVVNNAPKVFLQYLHQRRTPFSYHSIINISMKACIISKENVIASRETEQESLDRKSIAARVPKHIASKEQDDNIKQSRIPNHLERTIDEPCRPTTKLYRILDIGQRALAISFSPSGKLLAVGSSSIRALSNTSTVCHVQVYMTESALLYRKFCCPHHGDIYDLKWNNDGSLLVSASQDGTSKVWRIPDDLYGQDPRLAHVFQHFPILPIYCVLFEPHRDRSGRSRTSEYRVITGCYDGQLRLWKVEKEKKEVSVQQHCVLGINGIRHEVSVTALESDKKMGRLYSGDKCGCIIIWGKQHEAREIETQYVILRRMDKLRDFYGIPITNLHICHQFGKKGVHLLISGVGSVIRLFNLSSQTLDSCLPIAPPNQQLTGKNDDWTKAYFSPDGRYLVFGGKNNAQLWDSENRYVIPVSTY